MGANSDIDRVPIELRTPITAAGEVISQLCTWFVGLHAKAEMNKSPDEAEELFFRGFFGEMWRDEATSGDAAEIEMLEAAEKHDEQKSGTFPGLIHVMAIACAYAVQAMKAAKQGEDFIAWAYATDANYWAGILVGSSAERDGGAISLLAKKAADARHAENRAIASDIMEWFRENHEQFPSMDAAAEAATKIAPTSFRTARKHIGEAAKKYALRAKRKPST